MTRGGGWVRPGLLAGLLLGLGGCAEVSCMTALDRGACYAAYATYKDCKARNDPLIRLVDERRVTKCIGEPITKCWTGRDGKRHCHVVDNNQTCTTRWEPVYDYREFNAAVHSCMALAGQGDHTWRFATWD